jgi:hypothetical protein
MWASASCGTVYTYHVVALIAAGTSPISDPVGSVPPGQNYDALVLLMIICIALVAVVVVVKFKAGRIRLRGIEPLDGFSEHDRQLINGPLIDILRFGHGPSDHVERME